MQKSLDRKIARILADPSCDDFILADAKDADMAFGLSAPGQSPEHHSGEARFRTLEEYRQLIRDVWSDHNLGPYGQVYRVLLTGLFGARVGVGLDD